MIVPVLTSAETSELIAVVADHVPCIQCGYDLHGLPDDRPCPECATPVERSRAAATEPIAPRPWIVDVRLGLVLLMLAGPVSAVMACFPVANFMYQGGPRRDVLFSILLALTLFPSIAAWWATYLITRRAYGAAREPLPSWLRITLRSLVTCAMLVGHALTVFFVWLENDAYKALFSGVNLSLTAANALLFIALMLLARRLRSRGLVVACGLLAVVLPAALLWPDAWNIGLRIGLNGWVLLGTGFPQVAQFVRYWLESGRVPGSVWMAQNIVLLLLAAWALVVMFQMWHRLGRELRKAITPPPS